MKWRSEEQENSNPAERAQLNVASAQKKPTFTDSYGKTTGMARGKVGVRKRRYSIKGGGRGNNEREKHSNEGESSRS